ncbi:HAMP domain-containing sensor histidine kinase [Oscillibacter sp.]|uniref:sensor histidine kinase n=1 Tax=Oscillibacter sp. TaxID=1945593 RepID=UPI0028A8C6DE|nr:HAMP domain-containing sensor histidine kinase [Oscillibacter sp.]
MLWLCVLCAILAFAVTVLILKVVLLHRTADEIRAELAARLDTDTNTLITVSCGDRHMRRLAADLNAQLRLLRKERRRLQSGDLELKEAVTNISHDLRTPLTAICGYLELLKQEEKSEGASRYLTVIENRTEAMKQLTEELFRYSFITSSTNGIKYEDVIMNSVLEESVSAYYAALKNSGITPVITMPECKIQRRLDRRALARIFGNIISNAVKYSDGDLEITLSEDGAIDFTNSASQLDEIQVGKLFDRFYTVEDAKKSTGLGLSIAKTLAEQMNGTISARYYRGKLNIHVAFAKEDPAQA